MAKTYRRHEAPGRAKRRGPKNKLTDESLRGERKSSKQNRPRERDRLRKEWL